MINDDIKEKIQMLICGDLSAGEKPAIDKLIAENSEINSYYVNSKKTWENLDNIDEIHPSFNYVNEFWKKADEHRNAGFDFFLYIKNYWKFAGSFAVFIIAGVFVINSYTVDNTADFVVNSGDQEILNQLDNAITLNGDSSLEVYGPW